MAHLLHIKIIACSVEQFDIIDQRLTVCFADHLAEPGVLQRQLHFLHLTHAIGSTVAEKRNNFALMPVINAFKLLAAADRPVDRIGTDTKLLFDLLHQIKRIACFPVHLIDKRKNRDIPQQADLEQLARLRLNAFCRVDHHDRGIGRHQRAVCVLRKILMARRIEDVDAKAFVIKLHYRRCHRNSALLFNLHPVRDGMTGVLFSLDRARELDSPAIEQEFFRQGRFAGVRMRDNRKRPPALNFASVIRQSDSSKI